MDVPETLLRLLAKQRGIEAFGAFRPEFERAARALSEQDNDPDVRGATVGERQYNRWLTGQVKKQPHPVACRVMRAMFDRPASELLAPPPPIPPPQRAPTAAWPTVLSQPHITEEELLMTANDAASHAGDAASQFLAPEAIELLRRSITSLARDYHRTPVQHVFTEARKVRTQVERRMPLTHRPDQSSSLYLLAGQSCALMASAAFDLGSRQAAETLTFAALAYARPIDHHPLMAWASGNLSLLAYWDDRPGQAVDYVQAAQSLARSSTAQARLHAISARAHAHLGDHAESARQLAAVDATDQSVRDDLHDDIGGEFGFTPERAAMSAGTSWQVLGESAQAVAASQRALELVRGRPQALRSAKVEAEAAADLASGLLAAGELEAAAHAIKPVFTLPAEQRVDGLMSRLAQVRVRLAAPDMRRAGQAISLAERLEEFTLVSARTLAGAPGASELDS
ncbi:DNA-binding protein [Streptomyces sp. NPDC048441]|uniref:DNA-binding protein n=1 Tax=Streptomyces sp. NPDC048441 TaxID=3365552 RepID=UPI00371ACF7A